MTETEKMLPAERSMRRRENGELHDLEYARPIAEADLVEHKRELF